MQDDMKEHGNEIEKIKEDIKLKSEKMKELKSDISTRESSIKDLVSNKKKYDDALLKLENINMILSTTSKTLVSLHISLLDFDSKIKLNKELLEEWKKEYKKEEKYKNSQKLLVSDRKEKLDKYNSLLQEKRNAYAFEIARDANKLAVKEAIEKIFDVKVKKVRVINYLGKAKRLGRFAGRRKDWKKAIVYLADPAQKIDYFEKL